MSSITPAAILRATRLRCSAAVASSHQISSSNGTTTTTRSFAGGFQGPTSRGMGRDGGGRGPGGRHRAPRKGAESGSTPNGGDGFAAFQARRNANLEKDLDVARKATAAERSGGGGAAGGGGGRTGAGVTGFGRGGGGQQQQQGGERVHRTSNHPPRTQDGDAASQGGYNRPGRSNHKGGPRKPNFAETVLRPASEGSYSPSSSIPKLTARKRVGHGVHDEEALSTALPPGQRRSGRASVRGEMSNRVVGDLASDEEGSGFGGGGGGGRFGGMGSGSRLPVRGPIRERTSPRMTYLGGGGGGRGGRGGGGRGRGGGGRGRGGRGGGGGRFSRDVIWEYDDADELTESNLASALTNRFNPNVDNQDDDGYDSDADLEPPISPDHPDYMDLENHEHVLKKTEEGDYVFDDDAQTEDMMNKLFSPEDIAIMTRDNMRAPPPSDDQDEDPYANTLEYEWYFNDVCDLDNLQLLKPTTPKSDAVLPLKPHGPELDDWLMAVSDHPSKYMQMERKVKHPDSMREPRPMFPRDRKLPDEAFVNKYKGFLFVSGLVPHVNEGTGEIESLDEPRNVQSIAEKVATLFGVLSTDVSPASPTTAFIGFTTKKEAKNAMIQKAPHLMVEHPVALKKYDVDEENMSDEEKEFIAASKVGKESILMVSGLPVEITSTELFETMFPPGTKLGAMFGPLTSEDYLRVSPTTALINLSSADLVSNALKSKSVLNNVKVAGQRPVQVLRAKRERVFDGWAGPGRRFGQSKLGERLLVTGDVPPNEMYLSHNDMLYISGLPPNVTLTDLAMFFQPFSADSRDVFGSGHIVRCSQGLPTGTAYVGFELPGEINQVTELYNGSATIGGAKVALRPVTDKLLRRGVREAARPARSLEVLDKDLYNWERHVDPEEIKELEELGIEKSVLDEIFVTLRHSNRTFAAGDQAMSGERLYQEKRRGAHYKTLVRKYLKVLKSCVATKEEPGLLYEAMFPPEQEVDTGLFDIEEDRIKNLRRKGKGI
eukprot:scaffold6456_cov98-Skeletonema_dohrnii-CCMP3373.AAC.5